MEKLNIDLKNKILIDIQNSLNLMEETGKIDLSVLDDIEKLGGILKAAKKKWLDIHDNDGFYFYQAIHNVEFILDRMVYRFNNDYNPKIAKDSLVLLPAIDDILETTKSYQINDTLIDNVLDKTGDLRNTAADMDLLN